MKPISHMQLECLCGGNRLSSPSGASSASAQAGLTMVLLNGLWFSVGEYAVMSCLQWVYHKIHSPKKKALTADEIEEQGDQPCNPDPGQYAPPREYCSGGFEIRY